QLGLMESTNPCAELPLLPFESCNLGSIDVSKFVVGVTFDWSRLSSVVQRAVHFLDNVIDANRYPLPQIEAITLANRKIGLGVMGWADALIRMGVAYDSPAALEQADRLMKFMRDQALVASTRLANERGSFPNYAGSLWQSRNDGPVRNATLTAIA